MLGQESPRATEVRPVFISIRMLTTKVAPEFYKKEPEVASKKSDHSADVVRGAGHDDFTTPP